MKPTATPVELKANLLYLSMKEYLIAAFVCGVVIGVVQEIGRERQRRWVDKHMVAVAKFKDQ